MFIFFLLYLLTLSITNKITKIRVMFNPKQALQRIRRNKNQKQQVKHITQGFQPLFSSPNQIQRNTYQNQNQNTNTNTNYIPNFNTNTNTNTNLNTYTHTNQNSNIEDRVNKLQLMVLRLTDQLSNSNNIVQKLKKQNSNLQTQILKLQYENSQLKSTQMYSSIRRNGSNKKIEMISQQPIQQKQKEKQKEKERYRQQQKIKKVQSHFVSSDRQKYSIQVQQIIQDIKNEPLQNVLKRKQYQFRARKPDQKQTITGNKYLKQLSALQKQYNKTMKKPVLVIRLDDIDFQ